MGEDLSLSERYSVRTPMQWSDEPNAGFSTAASDQLVRPVISDGDFSYKQINVAAQLRDSQSLMNWLKRLIHIRRDCPEIGWGKCDILDTNEPSVFAHRCEWNDGAIIALHNLADESTIARLEINADDGVHLVELFGDRSYEPINDITKIPLDSYGCRWFRVTGSAGRQP
jgi:maltose alpha-D-glucosyltransferase/alpha-amylase